MSPNIESQLIQPNLVESILKQIEVSVSGCRVSGLGFRTPRLSHQILEQRPGSRLIVDQLISGEAVL